MCRKMILQEDDPRLLAASTYGISLTAKAWARMIRVPYATLVAAMDRMTVHVLAPRAEASSSARRI
jgi:hypothetical protein